MFINRLTICSLTNQFDVLLLEEIESSRMRNRTIIIDDKLILFTCMNVSVCGVNVIFVAIAIIGVVSVVSVVSIGVDVDVVVVVSGVVVGIVGVDVGVASVICIVGVVGVTSIVAIISGIDVVGVADVEYVRVICRRGHRHRHGVVDCVAMSVPAAGHHTGVCMAIVFNADGVIAGVIIVICVDIGIASVATGIMNTISVNTQQCTGVVVVLIAIAIAIAIAVAIAIHIHIQFVRALIIIDAYVLVYTCVANVMKMHGVCIVGIADDIISVLVIIGVTETTIYDVIVVVNVENLVCSARVDVHIAIGIDIAIRI
jgi:hypothetical protein